MKENCRITRQNITKTGKTAKIVISGPILMLLGPMCTNFGVGERIPGSDMENCAYRRQELAVKMAEMGKISPLSALQ